MAWVRMLSYDGHPIALLVMTKHTSAVINITNRIIERLARNRQQLT